MLTLNSMQEGSSHKCRVLSYNAIDGIFRISFNPELVNTQFYSMNVSCVPLSLSLYIYIVFVFIPSFVCLRVKYSNRNMMMTSVQYIHVCFASKSLSA